MLHLPILLIHGFNGQPANWTDKEDRFPEFLAAHDYDPALIRLFSYGFVESNGKPVYNATGDMRAIAHRLTEYDSADPETSQAAVETLSRDSVARGGPAKVTIIAHSSGGLIARYYLSCQTADEFQTRYQGKVERVIMLGTPHLGVELEDALDPVPTPIVFALLSRLHPAFPRADMDDLVEMRNSVRTAPKSDSAATTALQQIHPNSEFLRALNRKGAMPGDVSFFNIAGDIRVRAAVDLFNRPLFQREASLGDLLVTTRSACTIPNAPSVCYPIVEHHQIGVAVGGHSVIKAHLQNDPRLAPIHRRLRGHPDVQAQVLAILRSAPSPASPPS